MITLIEENTGNQVVLKRGDKLSYRKTDGFTRFCNMKGERLGFSGKKCDDGIHFIPGRSFDEVYLLAKLVAALAGLEVGHEIHEKKKEDYFVIEFI